MNLIRLAARSAAYFWRSNIAIALGVAAAVAILVGALLIGESMRGSLRQITLDRLGHIDDVLLANHFLRQALAQELLNEESLSDIYSAAIPGIMLPETTVEYRIDNTVRRAVDATLYAVPDEFWTLDSGSAYSLDGQQAIINQSLAHELQLSDSPPPTITLRLVFRQQLSSDSALGKKEGLIHSLPDVSVAQVIPDHGLGRFGMRPTQMAPQNVFVSMSWLQDQLGHELFKGKEDYAQANAIFLRRTPGTSAQAEFPDDWLARLPLQLPDLGLRLVPVVQQFQSADQETPQTVFEYFSLSADKLVFDDACADRIRDLLPTAQPVFTYLANRMQVVRQGQVGDDAIPFSMVSGWDWTSDAALISAVNGEPIGALGKNEIVLNEWSASNLSCQIGDTIRLTYFEPEAVGGNEVERSVDLRLVDVAKLAEPEEPFRRRGRELIAPIFQEPPTLANDPHFTPLVPGLTDAESIDAWSLPFETPGIRPADDDYWSNHRTTPKGFVSLETAQQLWISRFGQVTTFRIPASVGEEQLRSTLETGLRPRAADFGVQWIPLRANGLQASGGATPFDLLFLGLSSFVMLSALILITLLVRLALQQRANQVGILSAVGFRFSQVVRLWIAEMIFVCVIGGIGGVILGIGYAQFMLWGLRNWWVGALGTPFMQLHISPAPLVIGALLGIGVGLLAIVWTLWRMRRVPASELLAGRMELAAPHRKRRARWLIGVAAIFTLGAVALLITATGQAGEMQAGMFFGSGFLALAALLMAVRYWLRGAGIASRSKLRFEGLAILNAQRHPLRSTLTIGLVAVASFLITAISAFRIAPDAEGRGGFDFVATSNQPLFADLNTVEGRESLLLQPKKFSPQAVVVSMRLKDGDDASCTNPYQVAQPRVLGVSPQARREFASENQTPFGWAGALDGPSGPWTLLAGDETADGPIPAVIDKNTAWYSLKIFRLGTIFEVRYDTGERVEFQLVGLLNNTILQGSILIAEEDFRRVFPDEAGYRFFLIRAPLSDRATLLGQLENDLSDQGFDGREAQEILGELLAVQNTYLSAFQALGALGLLLGTIGLAAVQLRNILERRKELALFRAVGFHDSRLVWLVFLESFALLATGIGVGVAAALIAVLPHFLFGNASVPWGPLAGLFVIVLTVGWVIVWWSSRSVLRAPLLSALRESS